MINAEDHLGLVHSITQKRHKQFGHKYTYDDLYQEGCIGLLKAIKKFDKTKGVTFATYACTCIDRQILQMLRSDKWYGSNRLTRFKSNGPYSLDSEVKGTNKINYIDSVRTDDFNFERIEIQILVNNLPTELKKVVKMIYFKEFTQEEVAKKVGCSQVQISRLNKRALGELKCQLG